LSCFEKVHEVTGGGGVEGYWTGWRREAKRWSKKERGIAAVRNMSNDTVTSWVVDQNAGISQI
jgi:hypothetical protein